ncbi:U-box domain-containing protein [Actinidia chinensis var. chinensis]|uniref:RING-type E3 ubiquitin transferase n=1 Tax=Actinidia chinensis var. chinensis TaxID=1590841 RepID=A0A2R6RSP8_ACTCC|nr:U-box domain-containing protein [Actinidia chinensis var. chinensis]
MGGGEGEIEIEGLCDVENTIFVAVGNNVKESKSTLLWALQSFAGKKICLLHVHEPAHSVSLINEKFAVNKLKHQVVKAYRELEREKMNEVLKQYLLILAQVGVQAGKVCTETDNVEKGIVQIIAQHDIRWLVMGAAADKHYSKKLSEVKSKKATFVCQQAPVSCSIWFVCNGCLIYTRSRCGNLISHVGSFLRSDTKLLQGNAEADEDADEVGGMSKGFASQVLVQSTDNLVGTSKSYPLSMDEMRGVASPLYSLHKSQGHLDRSSSVVLLEGKSDGQETSEICDKLEHAKTNAASLKQKAFEESVKRWKTEEDALEAIRKAEALESSCMNEIKQRKEMEEVLSDQRQELERMKNQHDQYTKELQMVRDQKPVLESQLIESRSAEEELEEKIVQAVKLLVTFKEKRDKLQIEHDEAIRELGGLRKVVNKNAADSFKLQFFAFSFWEINEATRDFDPSWKIGDGRYGSVYKGLLRHLKVAIKMLPSRGSQGHVEFEHEAWALSRVRHRNLVTLIGTCPESRSLVYEYLRNGNLEEHLACQGKAPPLSWQTRTKIASELCSVLIFLHSSRPCIIHGNLKPTNVLLDANFVSKLSDLGIRHLIPRDEKPTYKPTFCNKTDPEDSVYEDPEIPETGELTVESDVYSFGIVLLRLLTGRPAFGIVKDVKCALERDNFSTVLDRRAGEWPLEETKTLAQLALRCCENKGEDRPDLVSEVWSVIELLRELCTSNRDCKGPHRIPSHFVCPIFQEVMKEPHIAADGFTYEADAIKGWFNSGHKTSPMTNLKLDHCDLTPNNALYNAIQEWQQRS